MSVTPSNPRPHAGPSQARTLRMDMKRAADQQDFPLAAEKQLLAEVVQSECNVLQAELKKMRGARKIGGKVSPTGSEAEAAAEEGEEGEEGEQLGERGSVTSFGEEDSFNSGSDKGSEDGRPPRSERQESIEV